MLEALNEADDTEDRCARTMFLSVTLLKSYEKAQLTQHQV